MNKNEQDQFGAKSSAQDAGSGLDGLSLPLSPAQLGVYFDHLNDTTGIRYNLGQVTTIAGDLDVELFRSAAARLVAQTPALNMAIVLIDDMPRQVAVSDRPVVVSFHDLRDTPDPQAARAELVHHLTFTPFDLARDPLFRWALIKVKDGETDWVQIYHHIIADGWSFQRLVAQLSAGYTSLPADGYSRSDPEVEPYADHIAEEIAYQESAVAVRDGTYWRDLLSDYTCAKPFEERHAWSKDVPFIRHRVVLEGAVLEGMTRLAKVHGTTQGQVVTAAIAVMEALWSQSDDIVLGTPLLGRFGAMARSVVSMSSNLGHLRITDIWSNSIGSLLEDIKTQKLAGREYLRYRYEDLKRDLFETGTSAMLARVNINQMPFGYDVGFGELSGKTTNLSPGPVDGLSVALYPQSDGRLIMDFDGNASAFDLEAVRHMGEHVLHILDQFRDLGSERVLGSLRLASEIEVECLSGFNATSRAVEVGVLPDLLSDRAVLDVGSPAVVFGDGSLSYGELEARSNALGRYLIGLGVGPDAVVGIALPRSFEMVIALVGVLKAGGAYLPLDPDYPEDRLRYMLGDSGADVVISRSDVLERLGLGGIDTDTDTLLDTNTDSFVIPTHILCVDDAGLSAALADQETTRIGNVERVAPLRPDHLAYVIYTSGSTGRPKGVGNTHGGMVNRLRWSGSIKNHSSSTSDLPTLRLLANSFGFIDFHNGLLLGLEHGERVMLVADPMLLLEAAADHITQDGSVALTLVPSLLRSLSELPRFSAILHHASIVVSGEPLPLDLLHSVQVKLPDAEFWNFYGMSEAAGDSLYNCLEGNGVCFGFPLWNTQIHVLSGSLQIVPVGVWGEMYISGAGLARGYVGRSDLTSERFIACPFGAAGSRMYRTGDLGRWRSDGVLEFGGRSDDQVKLRGFRIEPGEIEAALERLEGVGQAAVVVREIAGEARLVGYVTPQGNTDSNTDVNTDSTASVLEASVLRAGLSAGLPEYMVPSAFVVLGSFPLSPSGKLDRRGLPAPQITGVSEYEAPVTPDEALLCRLFGELTGAARVSVTESFFALGGHSLLVMRLVARVRTERGVELPLRSVFAHPSARALAVALSQAGSTRLGAVIAGSGFDDEGGAVLSLGQERLWSLSQLEAVPSGQYNIPMGLRLTGDLDVGALGAALECLVDRHAVLRTVIDAPDGIARGRVLPRGSFGSVLEEVDLRGSGGVPEREAEALSVLLAFARRPFDLACDVRLRALLVHVGPEEALLGLVADHGSFDGSSFAVFSAELLALYDAARSEFAGDLGSALAPLEWQFGDWAAWQRGWLDAGGLEAGLEYWEDHLSGAPHILELPTDYVRRADRARIAGYHDVVIAPEVRSGLEALALLHGTTLYGVLLAGLGFVLSGLTRQDEVVIGSPSAGRVQEGSEALLGFFVNTLALRLAPGFASDLGDYLEQVGGTVRDGLEHESAPFEQVVERVGVERSLSHAPVFQVMFAWQSQGGGSLGLGDLDIAGIDLPLGQAKFDLSVSLAPDADGSIRGVLEYDGDLFTSVTISRWCDVLGSVLEQFANAAHAAELCSLGSLRLASDIEVECLSGFNATSCAVDVGVLPDLLSDRAVLDVGSPAVVFGDDALSYGELEARSNALGRYLIGLGVGPDAVVGIALPRSFEMVIALVGVLKAGGAYLPLDPEYPEDRLRYMLGDSGADVVISRSYILERLGLGGIDTEAGADIHKAPPHILCVDDAGLSAALADQETTRISNAERVAPLRPEHLAYLIYTSGSTGRPKGVGNTHGGAVNLVAANEQGFDIKPGDRMLQFAAQSFDVSFWEIFNTVLNGGTLVLPDNEVRQSVEALTDLIATQNVTHAFLPPALAGLIPTGSLSGLQTLILGGEACTPDIISRFAGGLQLIHGYGPTETTVCAALTAPLDADRDSVGTAPIGAPLWNTQVHVLSGSLQIVPVGVWGEMYISGAGLARGYVGRSDLTSERFIACPFGSAGSRMYRTGDLGRWRSDGVLEFGGRSDDQVKLRGFRIEPGEIEAALERLEGVGQAAVVVREIAGEARLVGYVTPQGNTDSNTLESNTQTTDVTTDSTTSVLEPSVLRAGLSAELPEYMIPSAFVVLGSFPLSPSGKLDRRGLPAPEITGVSEYEAPVTPDEALLCRLFGELTGAARVSVTESFFALGGHSLLVMRLVARVRTERGVELPLRSVFAHPSARALAVALSQVESTRLGAVIAGSGFDDEGGAVLSLGQERLWSLSQLEAVPSGQYNIPMGLRLTGALDVGALGAALECLVDRHAVLRTVIDAPDGIARGRVLPRGSFGSVLEEVDLRGSGGVPEREAEALSVLLAFARRPFDLACDVRLRALLVYVGPQEALLGLVADHGSFDGSSFAVFSAELSALYDAARSEFAGDLGSALAPLEWQFGDWAAWQRGWLDAGGLEAGLEYWEDHLSGAPHILELPTDYVRRADRARIAGYHDVVIAPEVRSGLEALALLHGTTLYGVLLAGLGFVLSGLTRQDEVVIGSPSAGRVQEGSEALLGFFVNTLALRLAPGFASDLGDYLEQVGGTVRDGLEHESAPFEQVVERVGVERSLSHAPVFQVMFAWQSQGGGSLGLGDLDIAGIDLPLGQAKFDLSVSLAPDADGSIRGILEYDGDLFTSVTISRWSDVLGSVLEQYANAANAAKLCSLGSLRLASEIEVECLSGFNATSCAVEVGVLPDLLSDRAVLDVGSPAVVFGDDALSYGELEARSNALGRYLIGLGVGPDAVVGIALPRSFEMVIALVGVLKAGGAYLPLDPEYPEDRLRYMLGDSGADVVISRSDVLERLGLGGIDTDTDTLLDTNTDSFVIPTHILCVDDAGLSAALADQETTWISNVERVAPLRPNHLAYVIYTSGSTGRPKGVGNTHGGAINLVVAQEQGFDIKPGDRTLQFAAQSFDASIWEIFNTVLNGGALVLPDNEVRQSVEALTDLIATQNVTHATLPPALAGLIPTGSLSNLRTLVVAGEACTPDIISRFAGGLRLINAYGPTETTVCAALTAPLDADRDSVGTAPIGAPLWNTQIYVLSGSLQIVPVGVWGEMYISGTGLARGYVGRSDLTSERFIACPFGSAGSRMYRTGDLGRWRSDGVLEFGGRSDDQVKLRGFRIEPGEIEAALERLEGVGQAAVVVREIAGEARLVGYVTPRSETDSTTSVLEPSVLRAGLSAGLPEYMVPSAFVVLGSFPLSPSGKLDRRGLPAPEIMGVSEYEAPVTPDEALLCRLFGELTGAARVSVTESFFALGGDSISAIRLVSHARRGGLYLEVRDVFRYPDPRGLASVGVKVAAVVERLPEVGPLRATPVAQWFLEEAGPIDRFNQAVSVRPAADIDPVVIETALRSLISRHGALRLRYACSSGLEILSPEAAPQFSLDLLDEGLGEAAANAALSSASEGLSPSEGRMVVGVWNAARRELLLVIHHLSIDGVSWRVLLEELALLCAGETLPSLGHGLQDWMGYLTSEAARPERIGELEYWQDQTRAQYCLPLDGVVPETENTLGNAAHHSYVLDAEHTRLVLEAPSVYRAEINDLLIAALGMALGRWSKEAGRDVGSVVIDLEGHGREPGTSGLDLTQTIGWFTSLYPVRLDLDHIDIADAFAGGDSAGHVLMRSKEVLHSIPDKGLGYGVLERLNAETGLQLRAQSGAPIVFNYLGSFEQVLEHGWQLCESGLVGVEQDSGQRRQHLIDVNAILTASGAIQVGWSYPVDMIDAGVIARVAEYFGDALIALSTHCHARPLAQRWSLVDLEAGVRNRITALELGELEVLYPDMERVVALTPLQQGLVFESIALPVGAMDPYHVNLALELAGDVDPDRVTASWRSIVQRHEILRLGLPGSVQGQGVGVIRGLSHFDFRVITASETVVLEDVLEADRREGFDLCSAPLFRGRLILRGSLAPWLVISNHHVVMDGWSLSVLMKDLLDSYAGIGLGAHLAWWERAEEIALRPLDTAQAYWRSYLSECDGPCVLDLPVSGEAGSGFGEVKEVLSEALTADLLRFGRRVGITPAIVVQGAYMLVVRQLAGSNQVMIGTTRSGRSGIDPREDSGVGLYINTLPVYSEVKDNLSVGDWLSGLQQDQAEQGSYEHLALNDIQRLVPGGESGTGLFEAMYVFENYPERASSAQGAGALQARLISAFDATQYPLALQAFGAGELGLRLTYDRGRFGQEAAGHVMQQVLHILDQFRDLGSERVLGSLRLASDIEVECLSGFNATSCAVEVGVLPDLLSDRAVLDAGSPAVVFGDGSLSYGELEARSNALGRYLIGLGVGPDAVVGIALPRSFEMVIALVGVLKAGGAYLPLDPDYPEDRLRYMLGDSGADVVISRSDVLERLGLGGIDTNTSTLLDKNTDTLPNTNTSTDASTDSFVIPTHILCVDDVGLSAALADQETTRISNAERVAPLRPDHLAYVIYTSGSTGRPKGVGNTHGGAINLIAANEQGFDVKPGDRMLQFAAQSFDVSFWEIFNTVLNEGTLVLLDNEVRQSVEALTDLIATQNVTHAFLPPALAGLIPTGSLSGLQTLILGGEACTPDIISRFAGGLQLIHGYGPTEATVCAALTAPLDADRDSVGTAPIGAPLWNTQVHVLSGSLQIVPVGVWGEMYISGAGLARGYVGRSDLTSERFIACPFGSAGSRMYRTGDLGRWRSDGVLEFGGRSDDQVKLRGFRIEPGEIEAALERLEGVGQAAVVVREIAGEARLVGYVTPQIEIDSNTHTADSTTSVLEASVLRAGLSAELPEYMVPSAFVVLGSFPLSPSGKLDRRGLPAPEITGVSEYEAPVTPDEALLCRLFGELTGAARVSVTESFFALGGHSLLVMRLVARVRTERGVELPLRSVFAHPSARALAVALSQAGSTRLGAVIAGSGFDDEGGAVLSLGQERLWSLSQLEAVPSGQYNIPIGLRLTGDLDVGALGAALECLVDRHAVLRTVIDAPDGIARGRVLPRGSFGSVLEEVDLRGSGGVPEREAEALSVLLAFARRPFDLACDVRLRALLVYVGPEEALLGLVADHGSFDGSSFAVFGAELSALYDAARSEFAGDLGSALAPLEWQFGDWAAWQRGWLDAGGLEAGLEYWEDHLSGAPHILELPTDYVRRADRARIAGYHDVVIAPEVRSGLEALALLHGTTLYGVLLAGLGFVLSGLARQDEVVIGSPSAGRVQEGSEALLGFFVNTLALRLAPGFASDLGDYLEQVGGTVRDGLEHESAPFEQVVERVGVERSLSHAPVFQVMFAWQSQGGGSLGLGDLDIAGIDLPLGQAKFDLSVSLAPDADGSIRGVLEYDGDLFTSVTISRWSDVLGSVLEQFANAANVVELCSLGSLRLASDIEVECLSGFNATSRAVEVGVLPDLLSDRAVLDVGSPAVVFGDDALSYGELEARSNALGRYLIGLGVGPDAVVGIALPRSFEMVIALVGVLKAGGAYLPLDPEYPEDRLRYMLGDSGADVVISRSDVLERLGLGGIDTNTSTLLDKNTDSFVIPTHILCVDDAGLSAALADQETTRISNAERVAPLRPDHLAYVIYTSGSTGRPKGVGNTHGGMVNRLRWSGSIKNHSSSTSDLPTLRLLANSFGFIDFHNGLLLGLEHGERVMLVADPMLLLEAAADHITQDGSVALTLVPSLLRSLSELPRFSAILHHASIVVSGEPLPLDLLHSVQVKLPDAEFWNFYGMSEAAGDSLYNRLEGNGVCFGAPIWNTQVHVLSGSLQIVPVGVWGEMYISGAGLARGYVGRSDLTSERFIACPFGAAGSRMYRTGDLGRWRSDGVLEFGGRSDDQVKLRGFRIEPGEIEAALERLEGVGQAAVVVREIAGEARLVGYVTPQSNTDSETDSTTSVLEPSVLRASLSAELPEYMVPSAFVVLGSFPLSPSGKLDRRGLPAPEITGVSEYEAPVTPDEALLCRLFGELTGAARVSVTESFFALGGHSLLVMRLVARVRAERGVELPLRSVFAHPSARALAVALSQVHTYDPILPIRADGTERPLFCVHPASGSSTVFANLTNELPEDIPVYGMQAKHLSASETGHASIYEMAECYVQAMLRVQPQGPYRLLGWSLGGAIVQEMIAQLEAQGEIIDVALLLDSSLSGNDMPDVEQGDETELLSNIAEELGLSSKGMSHMALKEVLLLEFKRTGLMPQAAEIPELNGIIAGMHQASALMADWPGCSQLSAPITFVRASDNERTDLSERLSELTQGKVDIVSLLSTHFRMGNHENSRELALLVKDALKLE